MITFLSSNLFTFPFRQHAFLFENVGEELDPMIDPVLEKNVVKEGAQMLIKLGDKVVTWDGGQQSHRTKVELAYETKNSVPVKTSPYET